VPARPTGLNRGTLPTRRLPITAVCVRDYVVEQLGPRRHRQLSYDLPEEIEVVADDLDVIGHGGIVANCPKTGQKLKRRGNASRRSSGPSEPPQD
jgi:hypothetical protein